MRRDISATDELASSSARIPIHPYTHTPSAGGRILSRGTAFMTDVGMTGDFDSIVGAAHVGRGERPRPVSFMRLDLDGVVPPDHLVR
jgi:hypothetical protein